MAKMKDIIELLQNCPDLTARQIAEILDVSYMCIWNAAKTANIDLKNRRSAKYDICKNAPESCFYCPFDDCINKGSKTSKEKAFEENALGGRLDKGVVVKGQKNGKHKR